jgi:unsaturated rhamnogalacturonyl hydrolase
MAVIEYDEKQIFLALDTVVRRTMKMDLTWCWPCGVAFYGITRAHEVTKNQEYIDFLVRWVDEYLELGIPPLMVNSVSMGHTMITMHDLTGDQKYLDIALRKAEYLRKDATRFGEGVFQHTVSSGNDFPAQAWADTLFMAAYFQLRMGIKLNNKEYVDDALNQYYWHETFLQDEKTNLWFHAWDDIQKTHLSGIHWARANAWAAVTMSEALKLINYMYPMFMQIDCALRDQLSALVRVQGENGLWHTILDDASSYQETSASAGIGCALVTYGHPLHKKYVHKTIQGVLSQIAEDGTVRNVSAGTAVMANAADYKKVPRKRIQGWGQGLTAAFLASILKYKP